MLLKLTYAILSVGVSIRGELVLSAFRLVEVCHDKHVILRNEDECHKKITALIYGHHRSLNKTSQFSHLRFSSLKYKILLT